MKTKYHVLSDVTVRFRYVRGQWQASHGFDGRSYVPVPDAARDDDDDDGYPEEDVPTFDAHPIVADVDIPERGVKAGDLGGLLQEGARLVQGASCWVYPDSVLGRDAAVSGGAVVGSPHPSHRVVVEPGCHLRATDNARIMGRCRLSVWHLDVGGDAVVDGGDYGVSMDGAGTVSVVNSASVTRASIDCDGVLLVCGRSRLRGTAGSPATVRVRHIVGPDDGSVRDHGVAVSDFRRTCKDCVYVRDDADVKSSRIDNALGHSVTICGGAVLVDARVAPDGGALRIGGRTMLVHSSVEASCASLDSDVAYIDSVVVGRGDGIAEDGDADLSLPPDCARRVAFHNTVTFGKS